MTKEDWDRCLRDADSLRQSALKSKRGIYPWYMSDALYLSLDQMRKDWHMNDLGTWGRDTRDLRSLLDKMGGYTITRNGKRMKIFVTAEYNELRDILEREEVTK